MEVSFVNNAAQPPQNFADGFPDPSSGVCVWNSSARRPGRHYYFHFENEKSGFW